MFLLQGYLKLIDMGTAKQLIQQNNFKTWTIIGTPHYMAPEIITGKGYSFSVDYWSIGICLYEFMCGCLPFAEDAEDPYQIYEEIIKNQVNFPQFMKDRKAKKLIQQLINKIPEGRLGGSFPALKSHEFFSNLDWVLLIAGKTLQEGTPAALCLAEKQSPQPRIHQAKNR